MRMEKVFCSARERFGWENPEQIYIFKIETGTIIGTHFTRKAEEVPAQIRIIVDVGGKVEAEVEPKPDVEGCVSFIRFIEPSEEIVKHPLNPLSDEDNKSRKYENTFHNP
jgi:hypothetical protein